MLPELEDQVGITRFLNGYLRYMCDNLIQNCRVLSEANRTCSHTQFQIDQKHEALNIFTATHKAVHLFIWFVSVFRFRTQNIFFFKRHLFRFALLWYG